MEGIKEREGILYIGQGLLGRVLVGVKLRMERITAVA